jgi:hypothetical protein
MNTCDVLIDVPGDHLAHISALDPLRFRVQEDVVRVYYGRPQEECEIRGTQQGLAARVCVMHADPGGEVTLVKRTPLQASMFEWCADATTRLSRRVTYMVTHCIQVRVDAFEEGDVKTTMVWTLSGQDVHQRARVDDVLERLAPGEATARIKGLLDALKKAPVWKER